MEQQTQKVMFSSKSNEWETPSDFFNKLSKRLNLKFTLDPCCTEENHKCKKYYTIWDDGLSRSWKDETVFVNPPYGDIGKWVKKAHDESVENGAVVAMLIPARTDTKYWHDYIMKAASRIYFVKGRLKFKNGENDSNSAPFPSVVVLFGGWKYGPGPMVQTLERA
jgi:phage N-6-adenine-methyltransferase